MQNCTGTYINLDKLTNRFNVIKDYFFVTILDIFVTI